MSNNNALLPAIFVSAGIGLAAFSAPLSSQAQDLPQFEVDATWPKPYPNKWKIGGVTGLAVDADDNVWVYNRPNDLTSLELQAERDPPTADCCVRPPSMILIAGHDGPGYEDGEVIAYFDAPQGHGMAVDSEGYLYLGQNTVRKYDRNGNMLMEVPHIPENPDGTPFEMPRIPERVPGLGGAGPVAGFIARLDADIREGAGNASEQLTTLRELRQQEFIAKYPPTTPMIVGGIEEIRIDEPANEIYIADNSFGGRVMVFALDTFEFKRGWGAYGHSLAEISTDPEDHAYTPGGPPAREFVGHLTLNISNDGLVYAADRAGNRIHVTDKQGNFRQEFMMAENTGTGGSTGGVMFSNDPEQQFLYISDLTNNKIWFLDRQTGEVLGTMGQMGENAGQFFGLHMEATDSRGNLYTGEVFYGERVQRFLLRQ
ncbi:MAG TPA: hypothetical protein VIV14_06360 [Gammaproteobacteria bacterium]